MLIPLTFHFVSLISKTIDTVIVFGKIYYSWKLDYDEFHKLRVFRHNAKSQNSILPGLVDVGFQAIVE